MALVYEHRGSSSSTRVGSGVAAAQMRTVRAFDRVELAGANNVVVHVGGKQRVVVRADDNLLRRVTTSVRAAVVSGFGSIFVTARERLDGSGTGSGSIVYGGGPHAVTKRVTGSGTIVGG